MSPDVKPRLVLAGNFGYAARLALRRFRPTVFRGYVAISHKFIKKVLFHYSDVRSLRR